LDELTAGRRDDHSFVINLSSAGSSMLSKGEP
jgi:hypothetical protein